MCENERVVLAAVVALRHRGIAAVRVALSGRVGEEQSHCSLIEDHDTTLS